MSLIGIISKHRHSNKIAIYYDEGSITYKDLYNKAMCIGRGLSLIDSSLNVGILLPNSIHYALAYFSILVANKVVVPINPSSTISEILQVVGVCKIDLLISSKKYINLSGSNLSEELHSVNILMIEDLISFSKDSSEIDMYSKLVLENEKNDDETAIILSTSGTYGITKHVMLSCKNLLSNVISNVNTHGLTSVERTLIILPMTFSYCHTAQFLTHLYLGANIVIYSDEIRGSGIVSSLRGHRITNLNCTLTTLMYLLEEESFFEENLPYLKKIFVGAGKVEERICRTLIQRFSGADIILTYGLTEAGPRVASLYLNKYIDKIGSIGQPIHDVQVKIESTFNNVGELLVKSPGVTKGYYNNLEASKNIVREGWLHTGDLAYIDENGFIFIKGRLKNVIKSGGFLINPEEVESVILELDEVKDCIVVACQHDYLGEIPVANVVLSLHSNGNDVGLKNRIRKHCISKLSAYKIPYSIKIVESIERTVTGKHLRYRCED